MQARKETRAEKKKTRDLSKNQKEGQGLSSVETTARTTSCLISASGTYSDQTCLLSLSRTGALHPPTHTAYLFFTLIASFIPTVRRRLIHTSMNVVLGTLGAAAGVAAYTYRLNRVLATTPPEAAARAMESLTEERALEVYGRMEREGLAGRIQGAMPARLDRRYIVVGGAGE